MTEAMQVLGPSRVAAAAVSITAEFSYPLGMKRPTTASLKKVTADNLTRLGAERLAEILVGAAQTRPDLKRRLRMELAAEQGAEHLIVEIDKRLTALESSRSKVSWRQRPAFVRDLDALRALTVDRLAPLEASAALERLWRLMDAAPSILRRFKDRDGTAGAVFAQAAKDIGRLVTRSGSEVAIDTLVSALTRDPATWAGWLPALLAESGETLARGALKRMSRAPGGGAHALTAVRQLAQAANDLDALRATFTPDALRAAPAAAEMARRYLEADRLEEAGEILRAAAPKPSGRAERAEEPDFNWESAWIDYLDRTGAVDAAQAVRWASFERTLSVERARAFTIRLADFEDVEAADRAFSHAARHRDFERGLCFLMAWPALPEAARMIAARSDEAVVEPEDAELWAAKLQGRQPAAANTLLRKAAAAAFRRREFKTCDRLTAEADALPL